ncbi:hypothetical protein LTR66_008087 [Elasticomyces elasticus]|nr:hypothetical protein LTR66_008087 [Elasticomyces elasticus]
MESTTPQASLSKFESLPDELLITILRYHLLFDKPLQLRRRPNSTPTSRRWSNEISSLTDPDHKRVHFSRLASIFVVCRKFYDRGIKVFYGENILEFINYGIFFRFVRSIDVDRRLCIAHVSIGTSSFVPDSRKDELSRNRFHKMAEKCEKWYLRPFIAGLDVLIQLPALTSLEIRGDTLATSRDIVKRDILNVLPPKTSIATIIIEFVSARSVYGFVGAVPMWRWIPQNPPTSYRIEVPEKRRLERNPGREKQQSVVV